TQVNRQPDDDLPDLLFFRQRAKEIGILLAPAAPVSRQRRRDAAAGITYGQADPHRAKIDSQKPARGAHRDFSSPLALSKSTSCLTAPSSRRSATSVALPSCTISRLSTPTVAINCPASAAMTQSLVRSPQWVASTVLPSASCGCIRSRASQLPTSSQR